MSPVASAQDDLWGALSEEDFLADMPVVLSATRLAQPLTDVPVAMTIIDRDTIDALGATTIPDVLRLVPGFQVGRVTGSKLTVTYHGISDEYARNMQVLIDGRSVYDAGFGGVNWASFPVLLEDIQRIEVIRGPNSVTFGANAFSATINIITTHPAEQSGTLLKMMGGSLSKRRYLVRHAMTTQNFEFRLSAMQEQSDGLENHQDDFSTQMVNFRGDYHLNATSDLLFEAGFSAGERDDKFEALFSGDFNPYQPDRTINDRQSFQQIRFSRTESAESEWSLQLYHNYQEIDDDYETMLFSEYLSRMTGGTVPPAAVPAILGWSDQRLKMGYHDLNSERYDLELQHSLRLADEWRLVWGAGARRDSAWSLARFEDDRKVIRSQVRAFGNAEWYATEQLVLNFGLMAESYEDYQPYYSPRIAFNFHVDNLQTLRLSYSKAIRMPTLVENNSMLRARFQDESTFDVVYLGGGRLKPEEIASVELGYVGNVPTLGLTLDAKLYRDEIRDFIGQPRLHDCSEPVEMCAQPDVGPILRGAWYYSNAGDATISGYELGISANPSDKTLVRFSYAFAKASGRFIRAINEPGDPNPIGYTDFSPLIPRNTMSLLLAHRFLHGIDGSLAYYRLDGFEWFGDGEEVPGYDKVDVKLSYSREYFGAEGKLSLMLKNIGAHYTDFRDTNEVGPESYIEFEVFFD
ncbi:MAG: TonB-dependent receptor [Candidatus Polarisedimenticolaceae bacterium]|nr:TonB-dependent receptor [Candidatus Polarisedimenticolaceae bacterium]